MMAKRTPKWHIAERATDEDGGCTVISDGYADGITVTIEDGTYWKSHPRYQNRLAEKLCSWLKEEDSNP
jgi:hypothetical protein